MKHDEKRTKNNEKLWKKRTMKNDEK
jgi:hypothetical protein